MGKKILMVLMILFSLIFSGCQNVSEYDNTFQKKENYENDNFDDNEILENNVPDEKVSNEDEKYIDYDKIELERFEKEMAENTFYDLNSNKPNKKKVSKLFLVKPKNIKLVGEGNNLNKEFIFDKLITTLYNKKDYKDYVDEMSFNKFDIEFLKGEVIEIDSYPLEKNESKNEAYGFKIIDIIALSEMLKKKVSKKDLEDYETILFNLIVSYDTQYTSSGVVVPYQIKKGEKDVNKNHYMLQFNNENLADELTYMGKESMIGSTKSTLFHEFFHATGFLRHANLFSKEGPKEYENIFDVLGYASLSVNLNPGIRDYFNWLDKSNTIYKDLKSLKKETIKLNPLNKKLGDRVLKLQVDKNVKYYFYFLGEDKWFITNLKKDEDYSTYTGFDVNLTKEIINENKKGIFIVRDDGLSNSLVANDIKNVVYVFKENDNYENEFFKIKNIKLENGLKSINFEIEKSNESKGEKDND